MYVSYCMHMFFGSVRHLSSLVRRWSNGPTWAEYLPGLTQLLQGNPAAEPLVQVRACAGARLRAANHHVLMALCPSSHSSCPPPTVPTLAPSLSPSCHSLHACTLSTQHQAYHDTQPTKTMLQLLLM